VQASPFRKDISLSQVQWLIPVIPTTQEAEIGRITVQGQPRQKVSETPIPIKKSGVVLGACNPSYIEGINRRIMVQVGQGKNMRPYSKNN
jgi:hypothetical protein